jgi:hypothetical protein
MDALAHLALMTKAKLVFENPGTFLSFPALSPVSYQASDLNSFGSSTATAAQLQVLSEFSRVVNSCPLGTIFSMEGDTYLWDIYRHVLASAILASGSATPEDTAAYNDAVALLTTKDANGLVADSAVMTTYKQYRDAYFKATEDYKSQQTTASSSTDPAVKNEWDINEPQLRALVEQAERDWEAKGMKEQVEAALQIMQAHAARAPQTTWSQWARLYDPSIDILTDTSTQVFPFTSFDPHGIFDQDWPTFSLKRDEISDLADQAPEELKNILATSGTLSTVDALSFEYRSVAVTRPWFRSAVFNARFWQLPDGSELMPLSDGSDPPQGVWPAYVAALVFIRNISLTTKTLSPTEPAGPLRAFPALIDHGFVPRQSMMFQRLATVAQPSVTAETRPAIQPRMMRSPMIAMRSMRPAEPAASPPARAMAFPIQRINTNAFIALPQKKVIWNAPPAPPPPPPPPPAPDTSTQQGTRDDISILAFICKPFPKSPNPDPSLTW